MKIPRIGAALTVAAAALLTLSGCFQLPNLNGGQTTDPGTTDPGTTDPGTSQPAAGIDASQLQGTHWTGNVSNSATNTSIDIGFTLEADGTLLIDSWNDATDVPYDDATDTWTLSGDQLTIHLSNIQNISTIEVTGTATAAGPISLSGSDGNGESGYTMTLNLG